MITIGKIALSFVVDLFILMSVFSFADKFARLNHASDSFSMFFGIGCAFLISYYMGKRHVLRSSL